MHDAVRPPLTRRLSFRHLVLIDVVLAVLLALGVGLAVRPGKVESAHAVHTATTLVPLPVGIGFACVAWCAVAIRRLRPLTAAGIAIAATVAAGVSGFQSGGLAFACALVLFAVALLKPMRTAVITLVVAEVALAVANVGVPTSPYPISTAIAGATAACVVQLAAWTIGMATRKRRAYTAGLQEQAEERARKAVVEERLRIARELHDVLTHTMSVIAVQAGVGHHVIARQPEEAAKALEAIEATSRGALREMRQLLGVLRDETAGGEEGDGRNDLNPTPRLADLLALAEQTSRAGLRVELRMRGTPRELPQGIELTAYRIVQEALTNAVKHADTDHGRVLITYTEDELHIEVTDDGVGCPANADGARPSGHGLIGMRERVALYGGEFSAAPLPVRGFRVSARLPLRTA